MTRPTYDSLPPHVRTQIEGLLGSAVVEHHSQPGGYSPGTADRVRCEDGRRAFIKTIDHQVNAHSVELLTREAHVASSLPAHAPVPTYLGSWSDGAWTVLVLEDIDGDHPALPWQDGALTATLDALVQLSVEATPCPVPGLPSLAEGVAGFAGDWDEVRAAPPADLHPWVRQHLDALTAAAHTGVDEAHGAGLIHGDLRSDNMLLRRDGRVVLIDWPHAAMGAPWFDAALLSIELARYGGDPDAWIRRVATAFGVDPAVPLRAVIAALGYFEASCRRPPPPGLKASLRDGQRAQGTAIADWLSGSALPKPW